MLKFSTEKQSKLWGMISSHKIFSIGILSVLVALIVIVCVLVANANKKPPVETMVNNSSTTASSQESESSSVIDTSSKAESSKEAVSSKAPASSAPAKTESSKPSTSSTFSAPIISGTDYQYNTNIDIEDNVFLDSMIYTGYNIKKHRADGKMWVYILAAKKRGLGWLSDITYGGGSSGYETLNGKPNIAHFERYGLVCASYVTYVYFNYLPNVAGIDTSSLTRPKNPTLAHEWYNAAKDWIKKGYSEEIKWKASLNSVGAIDFKPEKEIPLGSIIVFQDDTKRPRVDHGSHVVVYAGYKNGYHWVYHVGNENGPEFCAVERMHYGPDPQWPLMVISTPSNIRMSALLEIEVKDETGAAVPGAKFTIKNSKTGKQISLGATDAKGKVVKESLSYGDYKVTQTLPAGYTCEKPITQIKLNTLNNSYNKITVTVSKKKAEMTTSSTKASSAVLSSTIENENTDESVDSSETLPPAEVE